MTTVTRVQLSTWTNKCRGNSIGFLLRNMDAISLSLGGIHTGPKLHSVLRGQITTQPKVMKLLSWHIQCSLTSEWAAGGSLVQHEKPPLQLHQVGAGNPPRDALGRLWHPRTRGKPAERHPDGYLHDAEDFWTVSIWHNLTYLVLDVLRQQELETYALTDLVPAIGGYLGLFIGFSCLGFFDFLCQFFGIIYNECTKWYQQLYRPCNPKWNWGANLCRIYDFILNVNLSEFEFRSCTKEEDSKVLWKDWL